MLLQLYTVLLMFVATAVHSLLNVDVVAVVHRFVLMIIIILYRLNNVNTPLNVEPHLLF
jgi:hypothetical protein